MKIVTTIPRAMLGSVVPGMIRKAEYNPAKKFAVVTVGVTLSEDTELQVGSVLSLDRTSLSMMKIMQFRQVFCDMEGGTDEDFVKNIADYACLPTREYPVEVELRVSQAGNAYFVLKKFQVGGRSSSEWTPEERLEYTTAKMLRVIKALECERDSLLEENHRIKSSTARLVVDYQELAAAYKSEVADANRLRAKLGIPVTGDNIVNFNPAAASGF